MLVQWENVVAINLSQYNHRLHFFPIKITCEGSEFYCHIRKGILKRKNLPANINFLQNRKFASNSHNTFLGNLSMWVAKKSTHMKLNTSTLFKSSMEDLSPVHNIVSYQCGGTKWLVKHIKTSARYSNITWYGKCYIRYIFTIVWILSTVVSRWYARKMKVCWWPRGRLVSQACWQWSYHSFVLCSLLVMEILQSYTKLSLYVKYHIVEFLLNKLCFGSPVKFYLENKQSSPAEVI